MCLHIHLHKSKPVPLGCMFTVLMFFFNIGKAPINVLNLLRCQSVDG